MPIQLPQWTDYLNCPVCENSFDAAVKLPISLGCGHTICQPCLANLQRAVCPFDQVRAATVALSYLFSFAQATINVPLENLPVNTGLLLLIDAEADIKSFQSADCVPDEFLRSRYVQTAVLMEKLAEHLRPSHGHSLSRPMQRKLVTLINCQVLEEDGRLRIARAARSLGERTVTELILQHQNSQQLSANLWAAVRARGCQFLGPAMQEEVLKLVLLALEEGSALSRKVLVMFVVQRLEPHFPQASKTSVGHVVQLLYRASCFKVTKRDGDSSLMQLKEEFRTYDTLRREHDAQIVQIATEAGLRIAPDQWSSLLYGDAAHKSHMQSIIDKLQTPQSFVQSVQELVIALQRSGDPGNLSAMRREIDFLAALDASPDAHCPEWEALIQSLNAVHVVICGLITFMDHYASHGRRMNNDGGAQSRYKTSMCRDVSMRGECPRGRICTFAHSNAELNQYRGHKQQRHNSTGRAPSLPPGAPPQPMRPPVQPVALPVGPPSAIPTMKHGRPIMGFPQGGLADNFVPNVPPVAQVAPLPRAGGGAYVDGQGAQHAGITASPMVPPPMAMPNAHHRVAPPVGQPMMPPPHAVAPPPAPMAANHPVVVPVYPNQAQARHQHPHQVPLYHHQPLYEMQPIQAGGLQHAPPPPPPPHMVHQVQGDGLGQHQVMHASVEHESNIERFPVKDGTRLDGPQLASIAPVSDTH